VACVAKPATILAWYRRLIAEKFNGSRQRSYLGRPRISPEIEGLIVRMARESSRWGYDWIAGALTNLGHDISGQTVGNVLKRHGFTPAPKRSQTTIWKEFIVAHMAVLAGADFFTVEVLTWQGPILFLRHTSDPITYASLVITVRERRDLPRPPVFSTSGDFEFLRFAAPARSGCSFCQVPPTRAQPAASRVDQR
jgi:hypothetical protein